MNREIALQTLNLDSQAAHETIEKNYRKLINRYPPEFHPDKFREIDDAYRFLTSFARKVEMLFAPESGQQKIDAALFSFENGDSSALLAKGMKELNRMERLRYLTEAKQ